MKILQVISSFPPAYDYGGPPREAYNLSVSLVEKGHKVTVYTTDAFTADSRVAVDTNPEMVSGIEVNRFRNVSNLLSWKNIPLAPRMSTKISREIPKYDIVHCHEYRSFHTLFAHWGSVLSDVPHVLQPHGSLPRHDQSTLKWMFEELFGSRIVTSADAILASSRSESDQFTDVVPDVDPDKIYHVPNAVSEEKYKTLPEDGTFRNRFNIGSETDLILFLSRLHPQKGGDLLIDVMNTLCSDGRDIALAFVGPDEGDQDRLMGLVEEYGIQNQTLFTGPLYDQEKLAAYLDADVFVLPSKSDSFGNVVIEAMACGTPTVMTNACGVDEWVTHDSCYSVEPEPTALLNGIETALTDISESNSLRQYVWNNFTSDAVACKTEAIYNQVL